jgi:two-component system response regulator LytT
MKVVIVEDEPLAVERLDMLLRQYDAGVKVVATMESIDETVQWFSKQSNSADLLLLDIHLADGPAFDIFKQVTITVPIVFTTAYDQYAIEAFKVLSVDYLLKPITMQSLGQAIRKMNLLRGDGAGQDVQYSALSRYVIREASYFKSRFLGRIGQKFFFINAGDIALFTADNRIVQVVTMDNIRYLVDHTLEELEASLDPTVFFRVNRSVIVHAAAIEQIKPFVNHRMRLVFKKPLQIEDVVISRERVADFKRWADS